MAKKLGETTKLINALRSQAQAAGTLNGPVIDRLGFDDAKLIVLAGAVSGAPTAQTLDGKIQHGTKADGTDMVDVTGLAINQITAANTDRELIINLAGLKQYIRHVSTAGFTGGTAPTIQAAAVIALGGAREVPVS